MSIEIDLVALKAAAEAAGGEAWSSDPFGEVVWGADGDGVAMAYHCMGHQPEALDAVDIATFIAAANPAVVLALIEQLRVAEAIAVKALEISIAEAQKEIVDASTFPDVPGAYICSIEERMKIEKFLGLR